MDSMLVPILMSLGAAFVGATILSRRQGNDRRDLALLAGIGALFGAAALLATAVQELA
jgi:hypothetical protein